MPLTCLKLAQLVRLEPVRSAEPPKNSGRTGANAVIAFCDAFLDATLAAFSLVSAINASVVCFQLAGSLPDIRRLNSAANSGCAAEYASNLAFQAASLSAPDALASQPS